MSTQRGGEIWIDVGAHRGQKTLAHAQANPGLLVYAFEPNVRLAVRLAGVLPNYVVLPLAIAERDGCAQFYVNAFDAASSLLPFDSARLRRWIGGEVLHVDQITSVATMRLDSFMNMAGIERVDYLKIDAQGADLAVVKSAGPRLSDIHRITLEVTITPTQLYVGGSTKSEAVRYLDEGGFELIDAELQSFDQEENLTFIRRTSGGS